MLRLRVHEHIAEIEPGVWDALAGPSDTQQSHRFIRTCEEADVEHARYHHVLAYRGADLVGIASLSEMVVSLDLLSTGFARRGIQALRHIRKDFLRVPLLFGGLPVSFGRSCLRLRAPADAPEMLTALQGLMDGIARERGITTMCLKEFDDGERRQLDPLTDQGWFRALSLPSCRLAIRWPTFEAYQRAMRSSYRHQVRSTLRSQEADEVTVRFARHWSADAPRIFRLYEQVMDRAPFQLERLGLPFFQRLAANLPEESRAVLVERDGTLIAAGVILEAPGEMTWLLAGIDYSELHAHHAYHHLVTAIVAEAIRSGAGVLEMGQTSYDVKRRLGGEPSARYVYFRVRRPLAHALFRSMAPALFPDTRLPPRHIFRNAGEFQ
jgi:predicted N-acyltransferase